MASSHDLWVSRHWIIPVNSGLTPLNETRKNGKRRRPLQIASTLFLLLLAVFLSSSDCRADASGKSGKNSSGKNGKNQDTTGKSSDSTGASAAPVVFSAHTVCVQPLTAVSISDILMEYGNGPRPEDNWSALQKRLEKVAQALRENCPSNSLPSDARISFAVINDLAPQPTVIRVLEGSSPPPDLGSQRALKRKTGSLFTVYIYHDLSTPIFTTYAASPSPSPVQAGLAQLVSSAAALTKAAPVPAVAVGGRFSSIMRDPEEIQKDRDQFSSEILADIPQPPARLAYFLNGSDFIKVFSDDVLKKLRDFAKGPTVTCVVTEADIPPVLTWAQLTLTDIVNVKALLTSENVKARIGYAMPKPPPAAIMSRFSTLFEGSAECSNLEKKKKEAKDQSGQDQVSDSCQAALTKALNDVINGPDPLINWDVTMAIYSMYSGIVTATPDVNVQTTYTYAPLTRWSFGLGAGAMVDSNWHHQVKAGDSGTPDPPSGALTSVNVYWSPWGYDETTIHPSGREDIPRFVGGFVLTPNPGVFLGAGVAWPWMRGITVNAGYAAMSATVPLSEANPNHKTKRGGLGAWVAELGYSF